MKKHTCLRTLVAVAALCTASTAYAQAPDHPWSAEVAFGFDYGLSGNINSGAIGTLNNQTVVILPNTYGDVYGTGIHLRFGVGYMMKPDTELRIGGSFQSMDADLTPLGDIGVSRLYAQYGSYQTFGIDVGARRYIPFRQFSAYGEGVLGLSFVDATSITLAAPTANLIRNDVKFYDKTSAFTMGFNFGMLWQMSDRWGFFGQLGMKFITGQAATDELGGTGLDTINDSSSRWAVPIVFGVRARF